MLHKEEEKTKEREKLLRKNYERMEKIQFKNLEEKELINNKSTYFQRKDNKKTNKHRNSHKNKYKNEKNKIRKNTDYIIILFEFSLNLFYNVA
jgi:hypothetical protein